MENGYGLTIKDYDIVNNLYDITKKIYHELNIIKENDKHNIPNNYTKIKNLIAIENRIYNCIDKHSVSNICSFISDLKDYTYAVNYNYAKCNIGEIVKARIVNKLNYIIDNMDIECEYEEMTDTELDELAEVYKDEDNEYFNDYFNKDMDLPNTFVDIDNIKEVINQDILKIVFKILDNEININYQEQLIDFKYNLMFMYDKVLNEFINKDFQTDKDVYLNIGVNSSVYKVSNELLEILFDEVTWDIIKEQINDLIVESNLEITTIIIRSVLIFSSESVINDFKKSLNQYHLNNNILNYLNKDKDIPKLVIIKK